MRTFTIVHTVRPGSIHWTRKKFRGRNTTGPLNFLLMEMVNPLVFTAFLHKNGHSFYLLSITIEIFVPDGMV